MRGTVTISGAARLAALILSLTLSFGLSAAETAKVLQVLDGDTCKLEGGRRVRYLGIEAPETGDFFSEEATQANNRLVGGKTVRLEYVGSRVDRDGRLLAYVFVGKTFVNEELVRQGFAHLRRPVAAKHKDLLSEAQDEARAACRGIWAKGTNCNIVITTVHARPADRKASLNDEYVVIVNQGAHSVNLTGWSVLDEANNRYLFPNFVLPAGGKVTLRTGLGRNKADELFWGSRKPIWNDDGDTIVIKDADGHLILSHIY